jgi:hypothetical protein
MTIVEALQKRALDASCDASDSQLMIDAAEHVMELEDTVCYLRSVIRGEWAGTPESDLNEAWERATVGVELSDPQFDLLFSRLDDRVLFSQLAKRMRSVTMDGGASYSVDGIEDLRAVMEQHLYEHLTGKE